jgi:hypothetical protein
MRAVSYTVHRPTVYRLPAPTVYRTYSCGTSRDQTGGPQAEAFEGDLSGNVHAG